MTACWMGQKSAKNHKLSFLKAVVWDLKHIAQSMKKTGTPVFFYAVNLFN